MNDKRTYTINRHGVIFDVEISRGFARQEGAKYMAWRVREAGVLKRIPWVPMCQTLDQADAIFHERRARHEFALKKEIDDWKKGFSRP